MVLYPELDLHSALAVSYTHLDVYKRQIQEFSQMLEEQQKNLADLQSRSKTLSKSTESFQAITAELYELLRIISTDLQESHLKEIGLREVKSQLMNSDAKMKHLLNSGIMVKLSNLESQLAAQKERLQELKNSTRTRQTENTTTLQNLQRQFSEEIMPELQKIDEHVEKELIGRQIKTLERDMQALKDEYKRDSDAIELEYSLLATHINNYMQSMMKMID